MNTKQIIICSGRAPISLDLARIFKKEGWIVHVAETFKEHLCYYSSAVDYSFVVRKPIEDSLQFAQDIYTYANKNNISFILPTCEEIFYLSKHKKLYDSSGINLFCESLDRLDTLHNKNEFIKLIQSYGMNHPNTILLKSKNDLDLMLHKHQKVVLKPVYSRFSSEVRILEQSSSLPKNYQNRDWVIQEFIEGKHWCSYSICHQGKISAHVNYPVHYRIGIGSAVSFEAKKNNDIFNWVTSFVSKRKYTGQISFDFIIDKKNKIYSIECNPRATSGVHLFKGADLPLAFLNRQQNTLIANHNKAQFFIGMLLYSLFRKESWKNIFKLLDTLCTSRDVIFSLSDLKPFMFSPWLLYKYWKKSRQLKMPLYASTTYDIEWNGEK